MRLPLVRRHKELGIVLYLARLLGHFHFRAAGEPFPDTYLYRVGVFLEKTAVSADRQRIAGLQCIHAPLYGQKGRFPTRAVIGVAALLVDEVIGAFSAGLKHQCRAERYNKL